MKFLIRPILLVGSVLGVIFGEEVIRAFQKEQMPVEGLPIKGVTVTSTWKPDFLWSGKAWLMTIQTDRILELQINHWSGEVPIGEHKIFGNHDRTNTDDYGAREFWGTPKTIRFSEKQ